MTIQYIPKNQATNAYPQQKTATSQSREATASATPTAAHPTTPAPASGGSVTYTFFRNARGCLKRGYSGFR